MRTDQEIQSVKTFFRKAVLFCIPFGLYALFLLTVDPFNYFGVSHLIHDGYKEETSAKFHYTLWKSIQFKNNPTGYVFFGDSRMASLHAAEVQRVSGKPYFNFAFGGGTIQEMIDAFWFADRNADLKEVYFGISFVNFNAFQNMNRFRESEAILENPLLYVINRIVLKSAVYNVYAQLTGRDLKVEHPHLNKEKFWKYQLGDATTALYRRYKYPDEYLHELQKISDYCKKNDIKLVFVIPPSHVDFQNKIAEFGLASESKSFHEDLRKMGRVIDFDFPNPYTINRENFGDPAHFHDGSWIIETVWGNRKSSGLWR